MAERTQRYMAEVNGGSAQPPHALRHVREVFEQLQICRPGLVMLVAKTCDLRHQPMQYQQMVCDIASDLPCHQVQCKMWYCKNRA